MPRDLNLRGINLNLLPVLTEIVRQRNLTRAAETLHMTQSAVSNSLKLLREHFQDEILYQSSDDLTHYVDSQTALIVIRRFLIC